ncbi:MAG: carboxypeptidase regulatory-like domain-containing protein, partial [Blastocatellia bacterium]|nr:carboxypeptidase regulatory-like domain-containing protein [Blastocatellia bacterium]
MRNIFLILLGILFCPILFSTEAFCQTGSIITQVKDSSGAAVSGAKLIIRNVATNNERTVQTDLAGTYQVLQLIPGEYEIRTEVEGFEPLTKKVFLDIGITAEVTFTLYASATTEIVEVSAANEIASRTRTESSTNVNNASIGSLPINRRNFLDFTLTSPRVVPDRVPGQGAAATSGLSFNGQPARQNNIKIDGFENNDSSNGSVRSTFSQDAVQEFQVISDSYSAEFGRALGGVVNIITKGGSNSFHTRLFGLIRNDEISARDAFTTDEPNYEQYQFGVTFGGPIKKDKAFFFTSFERLSIKQNRFVTITDQTVDALKRVGITGTTNGANPFAIGTTTTLARIDYTINPKNLFYFRYNGGFTFNGSFEPFGALISQTNSGVQNLRDNSVAFGNTYLGSSGLVNETRFIFSRREQVVSPVDNIGPQVQVVAPEGLVTTGQGTLLPQPKDDRIYQFVNNT